MGDEQTSETVQVMGTVLIMDNGEQASRVIFEGGGSFFRDLSRLFVYLVFVIASFSYRVSISIFLQYTKHSKPCQSLFFTGIPDAEIVVSPTFKSIFWIHGVSLLPNYSIYSVFRSFAFTLPLPL